MTDLFKQEERWILSDFAGTFEEFQEWESRRANNNEALLQDLMQYMDDRTGTSRAVTGSFNKLSRPGLRADFWR